MMTKKKTPKLKRAKFAWILPIVALLLFAFAEPQYRYTDADMEGIATSIRETPSKKTIKMVGLVLDENGNPMPGVSVHIKGTATGRVSDFKGRFELEVPEDASLTLSFVGKKTIQESYSGITSSNKKGDVYNRKYKMEDAVQMIYNRNYSKEQLAPPPPPPPPTKKSAKEAKANDVPPPPPPPASSEKEVFYIVEDMPKYPGGFEALNNYIGKMQQKIAVTKKVKGTAKVAFTVNTKGQVSDIKVVEKDNDGAAKGAYMIAKEMKEWTPGKQRGKAVSVKYLLPVEFK